MIALKMAGSLMILSASGLIGYIYSRECSRRPQELRILQTLLQMFENEITFMASLVTDSFEKIGKTTRSPVGEFFKAASGFLKDNRGLNASEAWEKAVKSNIQKTSLKKEDESVLLFFGKMLGNSDMEGQVKNIRMTINQLKMQEQKAEESRRKNENMYRSLGILGGLAIVIVLF